MSPIAGGEVLEHQGVPDEIMRRKDGRSDDAYFTTFHQGYTKHTKHIKHNRTSMISLPAEVLLIMFSLVPHGPKHLDRLRLVCRRFDQLLRLFEHSLVTEILTVQFPRECVCKFPGLCRPGERISYSTMDRVGARLQTLRRIERNYYDIRGRGGEQAAWMIPQWISLQSTGMLLLYRMQDCGDYINQESFLKTLPPASLAVLVFTLIMSIHQLRFDGPDILHRQSPIQISVFRTEIELACEELLLQHGPAYLDSLLVQDPQAMRMLEDEHAQMGARQMPYLDGRPRPRTLIAELRRALATSMGSHVRDSDDNMWDLIDVICSLDADGMEKAIMGQTALEGKRQDPE